MNKSLKENILFIMVAHAVFLAEPTIVRAESENYNPVNFTQPLSLNRGKIIPIGDEGKYLNDKETCDLFVSLNGWAESSCASIDKAIFFLTPTIDNVVYSKPDTDGFVKIDDWDESGIDDLTTSYKSELLKQSGVLKKKIEFKKWIIYPHLNKEKNYIYYAFLLDWDGSPVVNIKASLLDRYGTRSVSIVPDGLVTTEQEVKKIVDDAVSAYVPDAGNSYAEYTSGDKVAAYGSVGVLAGLLGIKYGKAATAGLMVVALGLLKKLGFLLFLPFVWLISLFKRK